MTDKLLTLREAADLLNMKRPNVRDFLARRGVEPTHQTGYGPLWLESEVQRVKAEREADKERIAADAQRRRAAVANRMTQNGTAGKRLGSTQRLVLRALNGGPQPVASNSTRLALRRLADRGLAERADGNWRLTDAGRQVVSDL